MDSKFRDYDRKEMKLGDFLLKMIFWSGMSQKTVADKCNMSTPVLNDIIKNRRGVNVKYAQAFEALFGVPVMIWLTWDNLDAMNKEEKK